MGANFRRRNYGRCDSFEVQDSEGWHHPSDSDDTTGVEHQPLERYAVRRWEAYNNPQQSSFRPVPKDFQGNRATHPNHRHPSFNKHSFQQQHRNPSFPQTDAEFRLESARFRKFLLETIQQTLRSVQQWFPDEESRGENEMDWQPESELVIPQPIDDIHYIWDPEPAPREISWTGEDVMNPKAGIGLGISMEVIEEATSEGGVGREARKSLGGSFASLEGWGSPKKHHFKIPITAPSLQDTNPDIEK